MGGLRTWRFVKREMQNNSHEAWSQIQSLGTTRSRNTCRPTRDFANEGSQIIPQSGNNEKKWCMQTSIQYSSLRSSQKIHYNTVEGGLVMINNNKMAEEAYLRYNMRAFLTEYMQGDSSPARVWQRGKMSITPSTAKYDNSRDAEDTIAGPLVQTYIYKYSISSEHVNIALFTHWTR